MKAILSTLCFLLSTLSYAQTTVAVSTTTITFDCAKAGVDCRDGVTAEEADKLKAAAKSGVPGDDLGCGHSICCNADTRGSKDVDADEFDNWWSGGKHKSKDGKERDYGDGYKTSKGGTAGTFGMKVATTGPQSICQGADCPPKTKALVSQ